MVNFPVFFRPAFSLSKDVRHNIRKLLAVYTSLDLALHRFRQKSSLSCPPHCGECCRSACVSASIIEMQPLAFYLCAKGEHEKWLEKIDPTDEQASCVFYSPTALEKGGHCHVYEFRPLLCRLFGFSARENKYNKLELMLCRRIKVHNADRVEKCSKMDLHKLRPPLSSRYFMKVSSIGGCFADECMNINLSFKKAVEMILFHDQLLTRAGKGVRIMSNKNFPKKAKEQKSKGCGEQKPKTPLPEKKATNPGCCS